MRTKSFLAVAAAILLMSSALAADLDANERKWVQECMDCLSGKSERCRASAERAISGFGLDALPAVVAATAKLKTDADWQAFSRAIAGMGKGAAMALDGLRMSWPKGTEKRLADVLEHVLAAESEPKAGVTDLPASPADVEARTMQVLDRYRGKNTFAQEDEAVNEIVAMGHPAIGALLKYISSDDGEHETWAARKVAAAALRRVVEAGDVPALGAVLRQGKTAVVGALANIDTPEAVAALVDAITRNLVDSTLLEALGHKGKDPRIVKALAAWLKKPASADQQYEVGCAAEVLADAGAAGEAATPALASCLAKLEQIQPRQRVALALVRLGERSGIPLLIDILTAETGDILGGRFDYPRHVAALALNSIAGAEIYAGKEVRADGSVRFDGDFAVTAKAFRAWWSKSKDSLYFDAATRKWGTK